MSEPGLQRTICGDTWWLCPNCEQRLGKIIGNRIVIRVGKVMLSVSAHADPEQTCPICGAVSAIREHVTASRNTVNTMLNCT